MVKEILCVFAILFARMSSSKISWFCLYECKKPKVLEKETS